MAEALEAKIKVVGDDIRDLKAKKASPEEIMPKVQELKALKAEFEKVTGRPFDPPKEKKKKKSEKPPQEQQQAPDPNSKKAAKKAANKEARKAKAKAKGADAEPSMDGPPVPNMRRSITAVTDAQAPGSAPVGDAKATRVHRSVTAITDVNLLSTVKGTVHFHPKNPPIVTAIAIGMCSATGLTFRQNEGEGVTRLQMEGGVTLYGDHSIAQLLHSVANSASPESPFAAAEVNQWFELTSLFLPGEAPLMATVDQQLSRSTFMCGASASLADAAVFASVTKFKVDLAKYPNVVRWLQLYAKQPFVASHAGVLQGSSRPSKGGKQQQQQGSRSGGNSAETSDEGGCPPLEGAVDGKVVTRFPPEPSGYLHIGHAKAVLLNEYYARHYHGRLHFRFDDTNPSKEKDEFEENILRDIESLGVKPDSFSHSSDHFQTCQDLARKLIEQGDAFMDDTEQEQMKIEREARQESKHRNDSAKENLKHFEEMLKGTPEGIKWCLRAKIDMSSDNGTMRDPVLYRANLTPHHRTGTKYKAYPTYDLVCPVIDSIEGITHALRTTEYNDRDFQYAWIQEKLDLRRTRVHAFSKLNLVKTVLSKRKLQWFVDQGIVGNWNDPRFPTVQGVLRRGVSIQSLRKFIYAQGASRNVVLQSWDKFWAFNKEDYELDSTRHFGVAVKNAARLKLSGGEFDTMDGVDAAVRMIHRIPGKDEKGLRALRLSRDVFLEAEDAATCEVGDKIILLMCGVAQVTSKEQAPDGSLALTATYLPDESVKKIKKKFNWVAATDDVYVGKIKEYGYLITKDKITEEDRFEDHVNPNSYGEMPVYLEPQIKALKEGEVIQLVRRGFFRVDKPHSAEGPAELILIPDGKEKSMSTLSTALPHQ